MVSVSDAQSINTRPEPTQRLVAAPHAFTIRDLLWLTLLAAVLVAWLVDRGSLARAAAASYQVWKVASHIVAN
jgi:hypothetical protein